MKKFIFFLLPLFTVFSAFAQSEVRYKLTIDVNVQGGPNLSECNSFYRIEVEYGDGTRQTIVPKNNLDGLNRNDWRQFAPVYFEFSASKKISRLAIWGERNYNNGVNSCTNRTREYEYSDNFTYPCYNTTLIGKVNGFGGGSTIAIDVKPIDLGPLEYGPDPLSKLLPIDDKITLKSITELTNGFRWKYSTDNGDTWILLPDELQISGRGIFRRVLNPVTFSGKDLFGDEYLQHLNKNILFKIETTNCSPEIPSGAISLNLRFASPNIVSATPIPVKCYDASDGGVRIKFDRALLPRETLNIFLVDVLHPGQNNDYQVYNIAALDSDNAIEISGVLKYGDFVVNLLGKYPVDLNVTTYTGGPGHTKTFSLNNPAQVIYSINTYKGVSCYGGSDGTITVNASGGTGNMRIGYKNESDADYTYRLVNNMSTYTLTGLRAGNYKVKVNDTNDCIGRTTQNQTEVTVTLSTPSAPLALDAWNTEDPLAFGASDGKVTAYIKGGTANGNGSYNIQWTNAVGTVLTDHIGAAGSNVYTTTLRNQPDGIYTLSVTDANYAIAPAGSNGGCVLTQRFTLTQPPPLQVTINIRDSISCNNAADGVLTSIVSGGVPYTSGLSYRYQWYRIEGGQLVAIGQQGVSAANLAGGQYQLKITDRNNIEKLSNVLNLINPAVLQVNFSVTPVSCYSGANGALNAVVSGGTSPYLYIWGNGATTNSIDKLVTGNYSVYVKDYHNCDINRGATVPQPAEPLQFEIPVELTYPLAYGYTDGSIKAIILGGTAKANGSYNVTWTRANGEVLAATGTSTTNGYTTLLGNVGAGDYTVTVTDANYTGSGTPANEHTCYLQQTFTLTEPDPLIVDIAEQHYVSCKGDADGVLKANASGGIQIPGTLYNYEWYILKDGTSVLLPQTGNTAIGLKAGVYKVIITDLNGITKASVPYILTEPDLLQTELVVRNVSCNSGDDGFIESVITGGTAPYTYSWSNAAVTQNIINIPAGGYTLFVTDGHSCEDKEDALVKEPAAPLSIAEVLLADPKAYSYTDGSVRIILTGGTPDATGLYNLEWLNEKEESLSDYTQIKTPPGVVTTLQHVGDGTYTLKVKDVQFAISSNGSVAGCYVQGTYTLTEPPLLEAAIRQYRYVSCKGLSDGQLVAHAQGGIPFATGLPYKYHWVRIDNGVEVAIAQTDSIITGMKAGTYLVKVTDANNITRLSATYELIEPDLLQSSFIANAVSCASGQDGIAEAVVTGGTLPYHYEWTTGETTATISNLTEGTYLLYVTDDRGCTVRNQLDIFIPDGIKTDPVIKAPTCNNDCDGVIQLNMSGGVAPYQYMWEQGSTEKDRSGLCAGKYTVTITDANGCIRIQSFTLDNPAPLTIDLGADKTLCNGQTWTVNAAINDTRAIYQWSGDHDFSANKATVTFSEGGSYHVLVTDGKGCQGRDTINIQQYQADIAAEFFAPSQGFNNETISFVNISYPMPDWVEWILPEEKGVKLISKSNNLAEVQFTETGFYNVTLRAHVGDCERVFTKSISILKGQDFAIPGGAQTPFILAFDVMPNPNEGQFRVHITLDKQSEIRLRMINIISNNLVSDRKESAATNFNIGYQLDVTAGTYLLLLETPLGTAVRKIILNK
jgi:hypothetical protein